MSGAILSLIVVAFCLAVLLAWAVRGVSRRLHAVDSVGVPGQVKAGRRWVPNTGGIAIFGAFVLPVLAVMWMVQGMDASPNANWRHDLTFLPAVLHEHVAGLQSQMPLAVLLLACLLVLHVLGLVDDRRPLGPFLKMGIMALPALAIVVLPEIGAFRSAGGAGLPQTRLLTLLDEHVGGAWLSIALTTTWFIVVTNAMNFMDNMDGLSAGVGTIAAACFLGVALEAQQWFVAACLALVVGALAGFLVFNFPWREGEESLRKQVNPPPTPSLREGSRRGGATLFMGDGGSLVVGFLLAFLAVRITYVNDLPHMRPGDPVGTDWHAVLTPLVILAVPLYDFASVVIIRLSQGKSPFVGDLQHLSHRIHGKGLTRRQAVLVIYLFGAAVGLGGVILPWLGSRMALVLFAQVAAMLGALALFEWAHARGGRKDEPRSGPGPGTDAGVGS